MMSGQDRQQVWDGIFGEVDAAEYYNSGLNSDIGHILELGILPAGGRVLDLGCGMAKTSLALAGLGYQVTAVDFSTKAIESLEAERRKQDLEMEILKQDVCDFKFRGNYDLIIAHGILQFLLRRCRERVMSEMKERTKSGGLNFVAVFTDAEPVPGDMTCMMGDVFREGELFDLYRDWDIIRKESYVKEDEHPGGIRHRHPINKLAAVKP